MKTKKILNNITLLERYNALEYYRNDCFKILNRAIPDIAKRDILLTTSTLEVLQEVEKVIKADIDNLNIEKINLESILEETTKDELAQFISDKICVWSLTSLQKDYKAFKKAQELNRVWSVEARQKEVEVLEKNIAEIEESIEILAEVDITLVKNQNEELDKLIKKKEAIIGTLNYKTEEEIKLEIYSCVYSYLNNLLKNVQDDIEYLERFV